MDKQSEFTGTHRIVLPSGYMDSIEFAVDLYKDQLAEVAANLEVDSLRVSATRRFFRYSVLGLAVWLLPASWMTCS